MRRFHRMPFGAEPLGAGGVRFRLWAPSARTGSVRLEEGGTPRDVALTPRGEGFLEAVVPEAGPGARYRYRLGDLLVPDPASRFQPEGVHGPSEVVDPAAYAWGDGAWRGRPWHEAVVYELHVGSFTPAGDYAGVASRLDALAALGVTALGLMPLAQFPGRRNWGYDGVLPFAPACAYGRPEDLKALVDAAHARGLMVLVDVVYNHFGPEGNWLPRYAPEFFTDRHATPWGEAIDFEGRTRRPVRDYFVHNALYWIREYHVDGLRIDAVHAIYDATEPDVLTELAAAVREAAGDRHVHLVLENDRNEASRLRRDPQGRPCDFTAQWNDDLHHALHVLLTDEDEGYYEEYAGDPVRHLGRCLAEGFAWQGEPSPHRGGRCRGEPSASLPPDAFVAFLQNHDQIGNRAFGRRIEELAPGPAVEAVLAILLLAPQIPLLFMGEERAARSPFPFFCDFEGDLAEAVREGRRREFASFEAFRSAEARARIPDPCDPATFAAAVLRWEDPDEAARRRQEHVAALLALRRREIAPRLRSAPGGAGEFEVLGPRTLRVRWRLGDGDRLHLLAHLGPEPGPAAHPPPGRTLFASGGPGAGAPLLPWTVRLSVEEAGAPGIP